MKHLRGKRVRRCLSSGAHSYASKIRGRRKVSLLAFANGPAFRPGVKLRLSYCCVRAIGVSGTARPSPGSSVSATRRHFSLAWPDEQSASRRAVERQWRGPDPSARRGAVMQTDGFGSERRDGRNQADYRFSCRGPVRPIRYAMPANARGTAGSVNDSGRYSRPGRGCRR